MGHSTKSVDFQTKNCIVPTQPVRFNILYSSKHFGYYVNYVTDININA